MDKTIDRTAGGGEDRRPPNGTGNVTGIDRYRDTGGGGPLHN